MTQTKLRPVLALADVRDGRELDWIVCEITSGRAVHTRAIPIAPGDMQSGRLRRGNSRVRPDRLTTLAENAFQQTIGRLTSAKRAEILAAARALF